MSIRRRRALAMVTTGSACSDGFTPLQIARAITDIKTWHCENTLFIWWSFGPYPTNRQEDVLSQIRDQIMLTHV